MRVESMWTRNLPKSRIHLFRSPIVQKSTIAAMNMMKSVSLICELRLHLCTFQHATTRSPPSVAGVTCTVLAACSSAGDICTVIAECSPAGTAAAQCTMLPAGTVLSACSWWGNIAP